MINNNNNKNNLFDEWTHTNINSKSVQNRFVSQLVAAQGAVKFMRDLIKIDVNFVLTVLHYA